MISADDVLDLVDHFYAAARENVEWQNFLNVLATTFSAGGAALHIYRAEGTAGSKRISVGEDDDMPVPWALHISAGKLGRVRVWRNASSPPFSRIEQGMFCLLRPHFIRVGDFLSGEPASDNRGTTPLTPRQQEVLDLVMLGFSYKAIALRLGISVRTVEHHVAAAALYHRLDHEWSRGIEV